MRTISFLPLVLLMPLMTTAQQQLKIQQGCAYKTAAEDASFYTFEPSEEARRIVTEICNAVGVGQNFDLRASSVDNALATSEGSRRIILYSTLFLKKFNEDARTRWAAYSVLAHEIGHHFNGHDFNETQPAKRRQMELEADRFSGSALRLLGSTLDEAKAGIETFALETEQQYHPSARARREALASGWTQQQERLEKMGLGGNSNNPVESLPRERDSDSDGIPDKDDACPEEFGRAFTAGCPDADEDGVIDRDDLCRYRKGPAQWKGCPDSDADGLPDHEDLCPDKPGYPADKGCPPPDRDNDGVPDRVDKCPDAAGVTQHQGCPDSDGDGVPDPDDKCPTEKGNSLYQGCINKVVTTDMKTNGYKKQKRQKNAFSFFYKAGENISKIIPGGAHYFGATRINAYGERGQATGIEYNFYKSWGVYAMGALGHSTRFLVVGPTKRLYSSDKYALHLFLGIGSEMEDDIFAYEVGVRQFFFFNWLNFSASIGSIKNNGLIRFGMGFPFNKRHKNKKNMYSPRFFMDH